MGNGDLFLPEPTGGEAVDDGVGAQLLSSCICPTATTQSWYVLCTNVV